MTHPDFPTAYCSVSRGYSYHDCGGNVGIYRLPSFSLCPGIDHGFTAKTGGVSTGPFSSLNLSFTRPEQRENVMENYRIFTEAVNIPWESMVMDAYEHGTTILAVDRKDRGRGYLKEPLPACDGLVTDDPEVTLITGHADCMAFFFYDPVQHAIGLCHAGWRGALKRIGQNVVRMMRQCYGCDPENILAGVGPSICPRCFEVGDDVADAFEEEFPTCRLRGVNARGKATVDLWQVAASQFSDAGIRFDHMEIMGVCTVEDKRLYSYRRDGRTGGMAAYLRLLASD